MLYPYELLMSKSYPEEQFYKIRRKRRINALKSAVLGAFAIFGATILLDYFSESLEIGVNLPFLAILILFLIAIISFALMFHYFKPSKDERKFSRGVEGKNHSRNTLIKLKVINSIAYLCLMVVILMPFLLVLKVSSHLRLKIIQV